MSNTPKQALERAIAIAGSQASLAKMTGISQPAISKALTDGRCGPRLAAAINRAVNVPLHDLRPDLFGEPQQSPEVAQ